MYSARLNAARIVPPMFQAVQSTMMSRRSAVFGRGRADGTQQHAAHEPHHEVFDPPHDGRPRYNLTLYRHRAWP